MKDFKMSWKILESKNNETKAIKEPMLDGPYLIVNQFSESGIQGKPTEDFKHKKWISEITDHTWGKCAFADNNGIMEMVFYHWDCS